MASSSAATAAATGTKRPAKGGKKTTQLFSKQLRTSENHFDRSAMLSLHVQACQRWMAAGRATSTRRSVAGYYRAHQSTLKVHSIGTSSFAAAFKKAKAEGVGVLEKAARRGRPATVPQKMREEFKRSLVSVQLKGVVLDVPKIQREWQYFVASAGITEEAVRDRLLKRAGGRDWASVLQHEMIAAGQLLRKQGDKPLEMERVNHLQPEKVAEVDRLMVWAAYQMMIQRGLAATEVQEKYEKVGLVLRGSDEEGYHVVWDEPGDEDSWRSGHLGVKNGKVFCLKLGEYLEWPPDELIFNGDQKPLVAGARSAGRYVYLTRGSQGHLWTLNLISNKRGDVLSPLLVIADNETKIPGGVMDYIKKFYADNPDMKETMFAANATGFCTREIMLGYYKEVFPQFGASRASPAIFLCDGAAPNYSRAIALLARQHHIYMVILPSHLSEKVQPMDTGYNRIIQKLYDQEMVVEIHESGGSLSFTPQVRIKVCLRSLNRFAQVPKVEFRCAWHLAGYATELGDVGISPRKLSYKAFSDGAMYRRHLPLVDEKLWYELLCPANIVAAPNSSFIVSSSPKGVAPNITTLPATHFPLASSPQTSSSSAAPGDGATPECTPATLYGYIMVQGKQLADSKHHADKIRRYLWSPIPTKARQRLSEFQTLLKAPAPAQDSTSSGASSSSSSLVPISSFDTVNGKILTSTAAIDHVSRCEAQAAARAAASSAAKKAKDAAAAAENDVSTALRAQIDPSTGAPCFPVTAKKLTKNHLTAFLVVKKVKVRTAWKRADYVAEARKHIPTPIDDD
jgi:DDE superfamily endonuclease